MSKVRVNAFSVSVDGFVAGPDQSRDYPLGRGESLFDGIDLPALGYSVKEHVSSEALCTSCSQGSVMLAGARRPQSAP